MYTQPLFDYAVLKERDARGRFICVQCVLSPLVLEGVLGENLYVVSEKDVCIHCCLYIYDLEKCKPKS